MATVEVVGGAALKKAIRKIKDNIAKATLEVGFFDSENATKAAKNEYGGFFEVDEAWRQRAIQKGIKNPPKFWHITPRPFMHDTVIAQQPNWNKLLAKSLVMPDFDIKQALGILGLKMQADIQNTISNNNYPETAELFSKVKGFKNPLIDTGEMLQSVTFEVHT